MAKYILVALGAVWAFAFLFLFWQHSQNGRYQLKAGEGSLVIDTRTGRQLRYDWSDNQWRQSPPVPVPNVD